MRSPITVLDALAAQSATDEQYRDSRNRPLAAAEAAPNQAPYVFFRSGPKPNPQRHDNRFHDHAPTRRWSGCRRSVIG